MAEDVMGRKARDDQIEDRAYCLLGLFRVHMPLLYGEGRNVFRRLQEEIIRTSTDMSIFVWGGYDFSWGVLATSPTYFADFPFIPNRALKAMRRTQPYEMTSAGLRIILPLLSIRRRIGSGPTSRRTCEFTDPNQLGKGDIVVAVLNCVVIAGRPENAIVAGIILRLSDQEEIFSRICVSNYLHVEVNNIPQPKEVEVFIDCSGPPPLQYLSRRRTSCTVQFIIRQSSSVQRFMHFDPHYSGWKPVSVENSLTLRNRYSIGLELLYDGIQCAIIFTQDTQNLRCGITLESNLCHAIQEAPMRNDSYVPILDSSADGVWATAQMPNKVSVVVSALRNYDVGFRATSELGDYVIDIYFSKDLSI